MPTRLLTPRLRRALIVTVLLALAMTQVLGVVHRALNGHDAAPGHSGVTAAANGGAAQFLLALFAGHHAEHDCKFFDQLAHADLASGKVPAPAAQLPADTAPVALHPAWHIAAQAAGFLARGPPPHV